MANGSGRLDGKVAIITGGTSGIGAATAELFIEEGATIVLAGRSREKGSALADRLGDRASYAFQDVTNEADIQSVIDTTAERHGRLDILFNNAGGPTPGNLTDITAEQIEYCYRLLFTSCALGIRFAIPHMVASGGGCIINNSSVAGIRATQGNIIYSAVKAGLTHYSKLAGVELGSKGIRVNVISPGAIATPIFYGGSQVANTRTDEHNAKTMARLEENLARANPLQRSGQAWDIATAALYLASEEGRFVNSHDLVVDGGRTSVFNEYPNG